MQSKIAQWGNSKAIRIPSTLVKQLDLKDNQVLSLEIKDQALVIKPQEAETIQELFADYKTSFTYEEEMDWGPAVGEEIEW
ncbi:AbrB/MazE/SpoVT family DNA-binding domain-containing protein [Aerococcus sp. UMB7834]|uniref:AbrB/MazE/SpoVT family DNA-binding domain-containing protein n=1 Tax=Aerococcus sp. UMB7834 TaxID=3046342 RepID=UPI00254D1D76|nr:AbrB/MazE/SpoVT family DNA-binding domain-containing protein [Aerococcus sp. UMB7834]MDK6805410.1 AbrB/MazE/SpoVT family DNA-binding domain-containing protein [Aerococcus sp. UMB7834]